MKTILFVKAASAVALLLICSISTANAKSWRINNDTRKSANFTDINAAMASEEVLAGDTLYLDPGSVYSNDQTITKAVVIVGNGYFLQNGMVSATINGNVYVRATYTKMMGVSMNGWVYIYADNVSLERCKIFNTIYTDNGVRYGLNVTQCYINCSTERSAICGYNNQYNNHPFRNATIKNNIIRHKYYDYRSYSAIENVHDSEISNNYLVVESCDGDRVRDVIYNVTNSQIYNNIIRHGSYPDRICSNTGSDNNNAFYNNVVSAAEGTYTNVSNIVYLGTKDFSSVFADGMNDAAYRLKADSPAKGVAADGGDCGAFGGSIPYVEGGAPVYHPYINNVSVTAKPMNGKIKLNIKAKMQNE